MERMMRSLFRILGSRRLAVTSMIAWLGLLVIWVAPFIFYGLPSGQIRNIIYGEFFFRFVYILLLVNLLACIIPRVAVMWRRARFAPSPSSTPKAGSGSLFVEGSWDAARAGSVLDALGFREVIRGEGWVWAVRRRWSPLGHIALHLGLICFAAAGLLHLDPAWQMSAKAVVVEGETFDSTKSTVVDVNPPDAVVPKVKFTVKDIATRFHEDILLFTKLDAGITDGTGRSRKIAVGNPWIVDAFTAVALEDFGYAPEVVVSSGDQKLDPQVFKLKAFPSGTPDYLDIKGTDSVNYRVKVRIYGDYVDRDGQPGSRTFNLKNPRVLLTVTRVRSDGGETLLVQDQLAKLGEPVAFGDQRITVTNIFGYGFFRITRSMAAPMMLLGVLIVCLGFITALLFPRQEVLMLEDEAGTRVSVRDFEYRAGTRLVERIERRWRNAQ